MPPSTASVAPVIADAWGEHKKATAFAMSWPSIVRPNGVALTTLSLPPWRRRKSAPAPFMGDVINPGAADALRAARHRECACQRFYACFACLIGVGIFRAPHKGRDAANQYNARVLRDSCRCHVAQVCDAIQVYIQHFVDGCGAARPHWCFQKYAVAGNDMAHCTEAFGALKQGG